MEALKVMESYLTRFPHIDGAFVANDDMAIGAMAAIKESGRKIPVTGGDALPDALRAVKSGDMLATFTHGQYECGGLSLIFAYDCYYGYPPPKGNEPNPRDEVILMTYGKKEDFPGYKSGPIGARMIYKDDITEEIINNNWMWKPTIDWRQSSRHWCKENNVEWKGTWAKD
jgi:ABC-type sugar transport system substrate-binding protein